MRGTQMSMSLTTPPIVAWPMSTVTSERSDLCACLSQPTDSSMTSQATCCADGAKQPGSSMVYWKRRSAQPRACQAAWSLVEKMSIAEREEAQLSVARGGLAGKIGGRSALELAREFVGIASEALKGIGGRRGIVPDESHFLDPVWAQLETGKSPGEILLERWRDGWKQAPEGLIDSCSY